MPTIPRQTDFSMGEVDTNIYKLQSSDAYLRCAQSLKNFVVTTTRSVKPRKGTKQRFNVTSVGLNPNSSMFELLDKDGNYYLILASDLKFSIYLKSNDGSLSFIQAVTSPYDGTTIPYLDYTKDGDSLVFTHQDHQQARLYVSNYSPLTFAYELLNIYPLPSYDFNKINYGNYTVEITSGSTGYLNIKLTNPSGATGFTNAWVGGQILGPGSGSDIIQVSGYGIINTVTNSGNSTTFNVIVQEPFKTSDYPINGNKYVVTQPAFGPTVGYPAKVGYHGDRLIFANTRLLPYSYFASRPGQYLNFDIGTGQDDDAIVNTIGIANSGEILWINGGKQLEIYCSNVEIIITEDDSIGFVQSCSPRRQSSNGSSKKLKVVPYLNDSYFVSKTGKSIENFRLAGSVGMSYTSSSVSKQSQHLVKDPINACVIRGTEATQDNFIYFLNSDSTMISFQFSNEFQDGNALASMTPFAFQPNVSLIDITSCGNSVYILKHYTNTDKYFIEELVEDCSDQDGNTVIKIDSCRNATMEDNGTINDLDEYEGTKINVIVERQNYGQFMVQNGTVIVPRVTNGSTVVVGWLFSRQIIPMYLTAGSGREMYLKKSYKIYVDYVNSLSFTINGRLVKYQNFFDIQRGIPIGPRSGTETVSVVGDYKMFSTFSIEQNSPFDMEIVGIAYQLVSSIVGG